jgi:micrococcal nuclease
MKRSEIKQAQESQLYRYKASLIRVVDGDTFEAMLELGLNLMVREMIRLYGVNTPELHGPSKEAGQRAKLFTEFWMADKVLYITSELFRPYDSFGRVLATVYREGDAVSLNEALLRSGNAVEFLK